jgi:hypothetical protein
MIKPSLQIMEATNSMPAPEFVGAQSSMDINDPQSNNDVRTKGRCKIIKGHGDKGKNNESEKPKAIRKCGKCKQAGHNSRKCPNKNPPTEIA